VGDDISADEAIELVFDCFEGGPCAGDFGQERVTERGSEIKLRFQGRQDVENQLTKFHQEPPSLLETLTWWWVVRPDLGAAIAIEAPQEFKEIIAHYILQN
jgi:hypothetical protein